MMNQQNIKNITETMAILLPSQPREELVHLLLSYLRGKPSGGFREDEYQATLSTYVSLLESLKGHRLPDQRIVRSQGLLLQIAEQAATAFQVFQGTRLDLDSARSLNFIDFASLAVITRSVVETFVCFHHVFVDCKDNPDEFDVRFSLWDVSGKIQIARDKLVDDGIAAINADVRRKKLEVSKEVETYNAKLRGKLLEMGKTEKQTSRIINNGDWRLGQHWSDAAKRASLGRLVGGRSYSYLSSFAHADSHAANQILTSAASPADQRRLAEASLIITQAALSKAILSILKLFPSVSTRVVENPKIAASVAYHCSVAGWEPESSP